MNIHNFVTAAAAAALLGIVTIANVSQANAQTQINPNIGSGTQANSASSVSGVSSGTLNSINMVNEAAPIPTNTTMTVKNVPGVAAPGLSTTLTETCMGSTSVGGAGVGFGVSFGTTWRDSACVRRLDSRRLSELGVQDIAFELMCDSDAVRAAAKRVGRPCVADQQQPAPAAKPVAAIKDGNSKTVKAGQ